MEPEKKEEPSKGTIWEKITALSVMAATGIAFGEEVVEMLDKIHSALDTIAAILFIIAALLVHALFATKKKDDEPYWNSDNRFSLMFALAVSVVVVFYVFKEEIDCFFDGRQYTNVIALIISSPFALLVWHWRDENKKHELIQKGIELDNQTYDAALKNFHEVQKWAAGHETGKDEKNHTLQIAAIYQLKPYCRGDHDERFRRPAFEIYRSLLESWHNEVFGKWDDEPTQDDVLQYEERMERIRPDDYIQAIHTVIRETGTALAENGNFKNIILVKANLNGANLQGANLQEAHLQKAKLHGANLQGANLQEAYLRETDLREAELYESNLQGAHLQEADLRVAKLQGADLQGAELRGANLQEAKLQGANLRETNLQRANLQGAKLQGADLRVADLRETNLYKANLRVAKLQGADLQEANLLEANLLGADLRGADLRGAEFEAREVLRPRYWSAANYDEGVLEELQSLYKELKERGEGGYWDPETEEYVKPTDEE